MERKNPSLNSVKILQKQVPRGILTRGCSENSLNIPLKIYLM